MARGMASDTISPERKLEIARMGGLASQATGKAHKFTTAEAKAAGSIGGKKLSKNKRHMRRIGRKGGLARAALRNRQAQAVESVAVGENQ